MKASMVLKLQWDVQLFPFSFFADDSLLFSKATMIECQAIISSLHIYEKTFVQKN